MVVGIDFDNTIVRYDHVMRAIAVEWGLVDSPGPTHKRLIRDAVRALPDGEAQWQRLQASAYGERIHEAALAEGAADFLLECRRRAVRVVIVSHKTMFAAADTGARNLRDAALAWLERQGFFREDLFGVRRSDVYFESTRAEKALRVARLGATHFIDDLEEVFDEPAFPAGVRRILYAAGASVCEAGRDAVHVDQIVTIASWHGIQSHIFRSTVQ